MSLSTVLSITRAYCWIVPSSVNGFTVLCKFTFTFTHLQCVKLHLQCKWKPCHGLPHGLSGEESACDVRDKDSISGWKDPLEEEMATHSLGKSHGQRNLLSYSLVIVQSLSHVQLFVTLSTEAHQASCPSPSPGAYSNSRPLSRWCHSSISSSVVPFSSSL